MERVPVSESPNNSSSSGQRRRRRRGGGGGQNRSSGASQPRSGGGQGQGQGQGQGRGQGNRAAGSAEGRNRDFQARSRGRRSGGRPLTANQVLVKYDNLLEQHLITRRKYFEYFNRADDRQLRRLEKNFFDSIEHLRRFEANLEPWQREALEKRKTERYRPDLTYSRNRGWENPEEVARSLAEPDENEDPHFKDSQREAFEAYKDDDEESVGTFEDYLKIKGQA
jgi:hypothetical protein